MIMKILGGGCPNCQILSKNTEKALQKSGKEAEIVKVTDMAEIMKAGVMSTPALVIDEKVVSTGKVLTTDEVLSYIK